MGPSFKPPRTPCTIAHLDSKQLVPHLRAGVIVLLSYLQRVARSHLAALSSQLFTLCWQSKTFALYINVIHINIYTGRRRPFLKHPSANARPFVGLHQRPIKEHLTANSEMALRYGVALRFSVLQWVGVAF